MATEVDEILRGCRDLATEVDDIGEDVVMWPIMVMRLDGIS